MNISDNIQKIDNLEISQNLMILKIDGNNGSIFNFPLTNISEIIDKNNINTEQLILLKKEDNNISFLTLPFKIDEILSQDGKKYKALVLKED